MQSKMKLYFTNLILITLLISAGFVWSNHNDFHYYGSTVTNGALYNDIYFLYPPGSFILNKLISLIFPTDYNYFLMRISSIFLFIISINILANFFLKRDESKIYFLLLTSLLCSSGALEIGSYTLSFLFFALSLVKFYFGKNNRDFFIGGFFFGLCLITRPIYVYCVLYFLLIISKKKFFKKYFLLSVAGGFLGILPYIFYLFKDFSSVIFWNYEFHAIHNEVYRWYGFLFFFRSILSRLNYDYLVLLPLLLNYLYYLYKNFYRKFSEFALLVTLAFSSLTVLIVHPQYFQPLFIIIILFIMRHINLNNLNRFLIISIVLISTVKFLDTYKNLNKSKYSDKNINSFVSILKAKKEIRTLLDINFKSECSLVFRTTSSTYLPYNLMQHSFNIQGVWLYRFKENLFAQKNQFFDYSNYLNFYKKDFNALLVGYYPLNDYELSLIKYAEHENWDSYYITNFRIFIKNECSKKLN